MTRISKRNTLLTLEYPINGVRDTAGHKEQSWQTGNRVWCYLRKLSGGETTDPDQTENYGVYECRLLFYDAPTLNARWRLRHGSSVPYTYYEIQSADQNELDRKEWVLTVVKDERNKMSEEEIVP